MPKSACEPCGADAVLLLQRAEGPKRALPICLYCLAVSITEVEYEGLTPEQRAQLNAYIDGERRIQ